MNNQNIETICNDFVETMKKQEEVKRIQAITRVNRIMDYMTECDCGFVFIPMRSYVKDGNRFCKCSECGELLLVSE